MRSITRRSAWIYCCCACLLGLCGGCHPYYALQRVLSPLGFAWYGDLLRLRSITPTMPPRLTADRWQRSVSVTVLAIRQHARREKWTPAQELQRLLQFAKDLTHVSRQAGEPFARWAVADIFRPWGAKAELALPFLLQLQKEDRSPLVRKRAFSASLALKPSALWFARTVKQILQDPEYRVRSQLLLALLPSLVVPSHPLHALAFKGIFDCAARPQPPPRSRTRVPPHRWVSRPDLATRVRIHCLRALSLVQAHQRPQVLRLARSLAGQPGPLGAAAQGMIGRLQDPTSRPMPSQDRGPVDVR